MDDVTPGTAWHRLDRLVSGLGLLAVEWGTNYGMPALKVGGKAFATVKSEETLVLHCALAQKELLIEMAPAIYHETEHYKGWPALLVRLDQISDDEICIRLKEAWTERAPASLRRRAR